MTGGGRPAARHGAAVSRAGAVAVVALAVAAAIALPGCRPRAELVVGSKKFTEAVVLGEIATQLAVARGVDAEHRRELGGTRILWNALVAGEIDAYAEYDGTIRQEILPGAATASDAGLTAALAERGIVVAARLGFEDGYAIGMREEVAARLGIRTLSDLAAHPEVALGLSHEFLDRADGWAPLKQRYGLGNPVRGLDHDVAYRALAADAVGAIDLYSTDAEIRHYRLRVLEDDRGHFPSYQALVLARRDLGERSPAAMAALGELTATIDEAAMIAMNAAAKLDRTPERAVGERFVAEAFAVAAGGRDPGRLERVMARTREHLVLVAASLLAAVAIAIPLGILVARRPGLGQVVLAAVGVLQTVPSLALLVLLIPLFGIGTLPALVAMFLYCLLPIVRNTAAGIGDLPAPLRESSEALGLSSAARLFRIELPLASRSILAGIKTSAVLSVGTATLGALIGAGGYGQPILSGIRLDDVGQILEGAVPAAVLALLVQWLFEGVERFVVPRGLRLAAGRA